ncbi:hypothetical protein H0248_20615 [Pectobacterium brasiliense]|uniref:hypothetical protein n=1 Tax=Pectobacterium brasiliense TaxID=180957 RepID=UPI0015DD7E81|nr:hypothetical protein [Pectobacterium brasiliense]MBA0219716.1 hypothetical protein [Pectobacterium brasiliense]MBN3169075.1 hypothetical protein [Pectobacterium brasiliense]
MKSEIVILGDVYMINHLDSVFDELSGIDFNKAVSEEINKLDEDLLMLSCSNGNVLDIGWYPAFEDDGNFKICIIKNGNWDNPLYEESVHWDKNFLRNKIKELINKLDG